MTTTTSPPSRRWIARIFISHDEPRLRAGWRLLLHTLLRFVILTILLLVLIPLTSNLNNLYFLELVGLTLATWIARRYFDRRTFKSLGFSLDRHTLTDLLIGFFLPALMMAIIYLFELAMGWLRFESWAWETMGGEVILLNLLSELLLFIAVGYSEELLSRGYHLQNLADGLNLPLAIFLSSSVFGILHLGNPYASWTSTLGIFAAGCLFAYGWVRTKQLWLPIGLHIGWNFFESTVFGFPVSGLNRFRLIHQIVEGPVLITGGEFGPEAGVVLLPVLALCAALIWGYTRRQFEEHRYRQV